MAISILFFRDNVIIIYDEKRNLLRHSKFRDTLLRASAMDEYIYYTNRGASGILLKF